MPDINKYKCSKCKFKMSNGWGYYFYVQNSKYERIVCGHPGERIHVHEVLGDLAKWLPLLRDRTGFNSYCVCLDCLHQFEADLGVFEKYNEGLGVYEPQYWSPFERELEERQILRFKQGRDKRECPECKSKNVKMELEMVGQPCPKCKEGVIEEIFTGARA